MKYNNKALKEARNLVAYAIRETAGFKVNKSGLLVVGYKYKDSPYAANWLLDQELKKRGLTRMEVYFNPSGKNRTWRNAVLMMRTYPKVYVWRNEYLIGGKFHLKSPLVLIPLRAISKVIGGNLPQTVLELKEFSPLDGYILDGKFINC